MTPAPAARMIDAGTIDPQTIELALIAHTNAGKTTLVRTLLGRDIGEVRDAPHVTEIAESHLALETGTGDRLRLCDTPGFGDSLRLVRRLRRAGSPLGWLLTEVWDRHRDRPLWCSQQAVRAARDHADVVLYLVNAAEDPRDAGYLAPEMQILRWIGKPVVVLLNQIGMPRAPAEERADIELWRAHLEPHGVVSEVLAFDAFARCWLQERTLFDLIGRLLAQDKRRAMTRLLAQWILVNRIRFDAAMQVLAEELFVAARDGEPLAAAASGPVGKLLQVVGLGRDGRETARTAAMGALARRADAAIRGATDQLIKLHGLDGSAAAVVLERLGEHYASPVHVDEGRAALWGSVITGALAGLKADLASGGLTLGTGMLVGGLVGGYTGAGVARGINRYGGGDRPQLHWSDEFLAGLVRSAVLRYLAVAHFGRGRGRYVEGEASRWWQDVVAGELGPRAGGLKALWSDARRAAETPGSPDAPAGAGAVQAFLADLTAAVLARLYPDAAGVLDAVVNSTPISDSWPAA